MKGSNLTLQINSLEALERLIGGDSAVEIEVRNNIVQEFTKKHLKALAEKHTDAEIKKIVEQMLFKSNSYGKLNILKPEIAEVVNSQLEVMVNEQVAKVTSEYFAKHPMTDMLNSAMEKAVNRIASELTDVILTKRLDEMVSIEIKKRLNLS